MSDFISLACPNCGAPLQVTSDLNRFACGHCGQEQIVKRAGGIVSLSLVTAAIDRVTVGTDKTAAELAIVRLEKELFSLHNRKKEMQNGGWVLTIIGVVACFYHFIGMGIVGTIIGVVLLVGAHLSYDKLITDKFNQLERSKKIVSN